jgi:hypothetical protein
MGISLLWFEVYTIDFGRGWGRKDRERGPIENGKEMDTHVLLIFKAS